jgi:ketosteroid isomerase-like protein
VKPILTAFFLSFILFSLIAAQSKQANSALMTVVESERSFARKSLEVGSRAAFMSFFADDAMVFRPHPVKYKEAMKNAPPVKNPLEATLEWEPIWADVSTGGDLGYTTGPSVWTDRSPAKRPTYYGFYFSFWKKQPTGEWKVVFDVGTELPGRYDGSRALSAPKPGKRASQLPKLSPQELQSSLMDAERDFLASIRKNGLNKAFDEYLDRDARVYRQKLFPIVGIDSIRAYFSRWPYLASWDPEQCVVAISGDLGYSYGSYVDGNSRILPAEKGYFLHGWKRDAANRWRLVAEISSPLPPETPKSK